MTTCNIDELVICLIARMLANAGTVATGSSSPVPAGAALLAQALCPGGTRALIFRNNINDPFPESGGEIYDRIAQGRIDVFFLSGGQIDGKANLNMIGVGPYPRTPVRFPGNHGTPFVYLMVPRVILYREEHTTRVLVPKVDFISAPGVTAPEIYRRGGPTDLVTGMAAFTFDRTEGRFTLASIHSGFTVENVIANTGFAFERSPTLGPTPVPSTEMLQLLRGPIRMQLAETYPEFAKTRLGQA
jgi:glutaconate CoA-transferase subunit B